MAIDIHKDNSSPASIEEAADRRLMGLIRETKGDYETAIGVCGLLKSLQEGRNVHRIAKICELEFDVLVSNSLLKMYIDCGSIREARLVFDQMKSREWTAMVSGYVQKGEFNEGLKLGYSLHGNGELGVKLFQEIVKSSAKDIDWITHTAVLYACCTAIMVEEGQSVFNCMHKVTQGSHLCLNGCLWVLYVHNSEQKQGLG